MYYVKYVLNGVIHELMINAKDATEVMNMLTAQYSGQGLNIIDIIRK